MDQKAVLWTGIVLLSILLAAARSRRLNQPFPWIYLLFFCSGFPALIYEIVWQRVLFGIYGVNVESVTIVVSAFMFGLGAGSLIGGALSRSRRIPLLAMFAIAELATATFGLVSLRLFHFVAEFTAGAPPLQTGLLSFVLVLVPTILMGATLPLLVEHVVRKSGSVGFAVGGLYFVNTLGSAVACFIAGDVLMRLLGQSGSVNFAVTINTLVGTGVLLYLFAGQPNEKPITLRPAEVNSPTESQPWLPFPLAIAAAAFAGFLALSYEIIWYRMLAFASGGVARVFAFLLGSYLLGIALGSRMIERYFTRSARVHRSSALRFLGWVMLASALASFAVAPVFAYTLHFTSYLVLGGATIDSYFAFLPLICLGAFFFGATFPLIAHVSVRADARAGAGLSYLYAANIIGSTAGSFVVGFVLMDHFSLLTISTCLLVTGLLIAFLVLGLSSPRHLLRNALALGLASACLAVVASRPVFHTIYDRLMFKGAYPRVHFTEVVETRSGAVGVTPDGGVYGGIYDGHFNTSLVKDVNMIARAYAISAFHPAPRHVLMIGLGSGSWAQIIAADPEVEDLTIVEINPAYLQLIPRHPEVASLLHNPKVHVEIDDGRRWLLRNRSARFDVLAMNSTYYWREHSANLLSADFLRIVRSHLNPGGVMFYNTTGSDDVVYTGLSVFRYGLRFENSLAVSDSPILFDRERWKAVLLKYRIDGSPVFDVRDPRQLETLEYLVSIPDDPTGKEQYSIEDNDQLRHRLQHLLIYTDDNMGVEWRG